MFRIRLFPAALITFLLISLFFAFLSLRALSPPTITFGDLVVRQFDEEFNITNDHLGYIFKWDLRSAVFSGNTIYFSFYYPVTEYDSKSRIFDISDLLSSQSGSKIPDFSNHPNIVVYNKSTGQFTLLNAEKRVLSWPENTYDSHLVDAVLTWNNIALPNTGFLSNKFSTGTTQPLENTENKKYFPVIKEYWKAYPSLKLE